MKTYPLSEIDEAQRRKLLRRPRKNFGAVFGQVDPILQAVADEGDKAVLRYTEQFDRVRPEPLVIDPSVSDAEPEPKVKEAVDRAYRNIYRFHKAQLPMPLEVETMRGVRCMQTVRPIERVGLYIPGGTALLPSTALMLGVPAMLAGCREIVLATPPRSDGSIHPVMLYIARKIGATKLLKAGGAQAIAAMAYGTESVPKTDKLFGPGNQYVTAAKMILQNSEAQVSIDMPAGPSEVLVIADRRANPAFVAADLLSQAEHGADSQVVLVATEGFDLGQLEEDLEMQLSALPRRKIAEQALEHSFCLKVKTFDEAISFSNEYAPEHLILQVENAESHTGKIFNAGSVFLGPWSPESVGDYASGTNHTLPTYGYARNYSGVNLRSFMKSITMQHLTGEGLQAIGPTVETLAELEELQAHKNAVSVRLKALQKLNNTAIDTEE